VSQHSPARKVALVTGAAGGIGSAISRRLMDADVEVALLDTAAPTEARALNLAADVSKPEDIQRAVAAVGDHFGALHIVVNAAGVCPRTQFDDITPEEWERVLAINLTGPFLVAHAAMPALRRAGWGRIVNIASLGGQVGGIAVGAHYVASKAGLVGLTKTLALLGAPYGITANAVAPGVIDTEMTRQASAEQAKSYLARIPLGYIGEAKDVAEVVAFLCSDGARYITGSVIDVNGGMLMR